ncbi:MAG: ATP synthase F1 subunit delta [Chloroflexota bacterium]
MARKAYAKRYAEAIFQIAFEKKELDRWQTDLNKIASLTEDMGLVALLENPKLPFDNKAKILAEQLHDINPLALNLLYLLVTGRRVSLGGEIEREYQRLFNSHQGIELAEVSTAVPLDEKDKEELTGRLSTLATKKVVIEAEVNPSLVGGIVARIGGKLLDASTRTRLEALKRELSGMKR